MDLSGERAAYVRHSRLVSMLRKSLTGSRASSAKGKKSCYILSLGLQYIEQASHAERSVAMRSP